MFKKCLFSVVLMLGWSVVLHAQNLSRIVNEKGEPVEGAIVTFTSLSGQQIHSGISDRKGGVVFPQMEPPVIMRVQMMGYVSLADTLVTAIPVKLALKRAPASLGEVVVTGDYSAGYQSGSVHQVDVITRDEIERRGSVNMQELLSQELNMRISTDPALGSSLSLQGTSGEHIKFLVDGVPLTGRKNGNIDLGQLNLNNVERIEVVKGPMSVLYGTDALGGVINIITKKPQAGITSARVNSYYESNGNYNLDFGAGTGFKNTSITLNGGRNFFDGWSEKDTARWQQWKPREQYFGDVRLATTYRRTAVTLTSSYFQEDVFNKSEPVVTPYFAYATDQTYHTWRVNQQLQLSQQLSKSSTLQFTGAYSWYRYIKNTWRKDMVSLNQELTGDPMDDDTTTFKTLFSRAVYSWKPDSANWNIMAGAEFNNDHAAGQRIDGQEHVITDVAVFASVDYNWKSFTFRPSARYTYNSRYDAPLVPAFNIMYKAGNFTFRTGYSAGFRAPSLKELYLSFFDNGIHNVQGNENLKAENSDNFLFSTEFRSAVKKANLVLNMSAFYNAIRDRITLVEKDFTTGLFQYDNLDNFYVRGAEMRGRITYSQLSFEAGAAYTGTDEQIHGYERQSEIAWYPEVTASADYTLKKSKTTLSLFWKNYGERPVYRYVGEVPERFLNEAYQLMDVSVRQLLLKDRLQVTTGLKNIMNVRQVRTASAGGIHSGGSSNSSAIAMGTTFFAKLSYTFK